MNKFKSFIFKGYQFDKKARKLFFHYSLDNQVNFTEIIELDKEIEPKVLNEAESVALNNTLQSLHLMLGVSYYKTFCPENIVIENYKINKEQADFFEKVYKNGLGEFYYVNNLTPKTRIGFPYSNIKVGAPSLNLEKRSIVPVGGGKDSIVTIELLKDRGENFSLFSLGSSETRRDIAKISGKEIIVFERILAPELFKLNDSGAYNGHVPFSAILASLMPVVGILYGFDNAVLSNEASAEEPNIKVGDLSINHQYSKSYEFEKDFSNYLNKYISSNFKYYSLLRSYKEIEIAELFAKYHKYFPYFSSCNVVQRKTNKNKKIKWCNNCPKCLFTYLILAPYINKVEMYKIFGDNLLDKKNMELVMKDLVGLGEHKPFECVGQYDECVESLKKLSALDDYKSGYLVVNNPILA